MGILLWIVFGLIAGVIAKFLMPGRDPGGIIVTILLGIGGAIVGGFVAAYFGFGDMTRFDIRSLLIAIGGAMLLLLVYRLLATRSTA
ncbi:MAG: GlsB/YeaQ/YmgE family stress response membrane protein [Terriglobales bacterium]